MASPSSPPKPLKSGSPSPSPSVRISSPLNPNPNPNPNWSPHPTPPTLARQRRASFTLAHRDESMSYSAFASVAASSQLNPQSHSANTSPGQSSADLPQMDLLSNVRRGHSRSPHLRSSLDLTRPRALSSASSHGGNGSAHGHSPRVSSVDLTHSRTHSPSPGLPPLLQGLPLEQGSLDFSYTYTQSQTQPIDIPNHGSVVTRHHVPGDVTPPNEPPRTWWSKKMPYDPVEPAWGANADPYKAIGAHGDDNESDDDVGIEWEKGWAEGGGFETNVVPAGVGDDAGNGNAAAGFVTANEGTGRGRIERKGSSFGIGLGRVLKGRSASREKSRSVSHSQTHSRNPSIESSSQCASQFASESYQNSSPQSNYGAPHSGAQAINIPVSSTKARRPSHSHSNSLGNSYPTQFQLRNLSSNSSPSSSAHDGLSALALGMEERERAERKSRGLFSRKGHAKDSDGDISGEIAIDSAKSTPKEHTQSWIKRASWAGLYGKEASPSSGGKDIPTKEDSGHGKDKQDGKQCKEKEGHKWKTEDAQEEEYEHARGYVALAIRSILPADTLATMAQAGHTASHIAHLSLPIAKEALIVGTELLHFAPFPFLDEAARTLLNIWEAIEVVDMNRLACLRLTERSARLLYNVRCEIQEAGDQVADELQHPIDKLTAALNEVYNFLTRLIRRPFIKRYLRRLEIMREIAACDRALADVLAMFGISIQVRILKQVQAVSEESRKLAEEAHEHYRLMQTRVYAMDQGRPQLQLPSLDNALGLTGVGEQRPGFGVHPVPTLGLLSPSSSMLSPPPVYSLDQITPTQSNQGTEMLTPSFSHHSIPSSQIILPPSASSIQQIQISEQLTQAVVQHTSEALSPLLTLAELRTTQNAVDSARDNAALRAALRKVMSSWSDEELIKQIQVGQEEIPEAIKTFRRALESLEDDEPDIQDEIDAIYPVRFEPDAAAVHAPGGSSSAPGETEARRRDTLDREFMESGIDAMTRLSSVQSQKARAVGADVDPKDLPSWTITRYEVDRLRKIGVGFFSEVYLGRWRDLPVAIKVLSSATTQSTFIREVLIWRELRHPNILRLYGASSTTGEKPWFFVSPYCAGGTLVAWLNAARDRARDRLGGHAVEMERGRSMFGMGSGSGGIGLSGNSHGVGTGVCEAAMANPKQMGRRVISSGNLDSRAGIEEIDLVRCMHQIAKGMEHLHDKGVLHGDLKAVNVLVDEIGRCIVSDFGQSEIKSEVYRISQKPLPRGTLRWQAPELLMGDGKLTTAVDVYAFSICCVEILGMGDLPWQLQDDTTVANLVRVRDSRPVIPMTRYTTTVAPLISSCWSRNPASRPTFGHIATALSQMRKRFDARGIEDSPLPHSNELWDQQPDWMIRTRVSPDMHPGPLLGIGISPTTETLVGGEYEDKDQEDTASSPSDGVYETASEITPVDEENSDEVYEIVESSSSSSSHRLIPFRPAVASHRGHPNSQSFDDSKPVGMPEPVLYTPSRKYSLPSMGSGTCSSSASSVLTSSPEEKHLSPHNHGAHFGGYDSPPPTNEIFAAGRNERRYRILARDTHKFHSSLKLPLWSPSHVSLGAVGYLSKPKGEFITLFNAMNPPQSSGGKLMDMASLRGYGNFNIERQKPQNKRNAAQRGFLDPLAGLLTFKPKGGGSSSHRQQSVSRRYSFPLRAGHKEAHICAETTMYRYIDDVEPAKKWFKHNVNEIIQNYTPEHPIQREDIFVVIGALDAPDYALFVSHSHPEGQAYFNVFSPPKVGRAWGTFTTDSVSSSESGPSYHEEVPGNAVFAGKISDSRGGNVSSSKWDSLILARLRFKPDVDEPTSL